ncbi:MAG: hypothetical protein AAFV86_19905 [Pseudomonadota bacterium]
MRPFPESEQHQWLYAAAYDRSRIARMVYAHLSVLDSKSSALLRFNGIAIALAGFLLLERGAWLGGAPPAAAVLVWLGFAGYAASVALCYSVVSLFWYPAGTLVRQAEFEVAERAAFEGLKPFTTTRDSEPNAMGFAVLNARCRRYRLAFYASGLASVLFLAGFVVFMASVPAP